MSTNKNDLYKQFRTDIEAYLEELYPPEFYHEIEGHESRLAILKLNDVLLTLGDASLALIYSDDEEQSEIEDKFERSIVQRYHIRHAIIDLNNSFDLLLQVLWFFYRVWNFFNPDGIYRSDKDFTDIVRNQDGWVEKAEDACLYRMVVNHFLKYSKDNEHSLYQDFKAFNNLFIFNDSKPFTVRTISNFIKHNGALKTSEQQTPWNFSIKDTEGNIYDPHKYRCEISTKFYTPETSEKNYLGEIRLNYTDDLYVDIEYKGGELFRGKDYAYDYKHYSIKELHIEALSYFENFIKLFDKVYKLIMPQISDSPILKKSKVHVEHNSINLDKYFKSKS